MNSHEKSQGALQSSRGPNDGASPHATTFIVRISQIDVDPVIGIVERVRTGQKERFYGLDGINQVIAQMVERERRARTSPDQDPGG
jgi:hypothetical protein